MIKIKFLTIIFTLLLTFNSNAAVAKISKVPIMLDEPICDLKDIKRASQIPGVGLCKLKLKR